MMTRRFESALLSLSFLLIAPSAAIGADAPRVTPDHSYYTSITELPTNQESGVDIDQFIGYPGKAFTKISNGLMTQSMLRAGNPYKPGPAGAVLEYRDDLSVATLPPHYETGAAATDQVTFYYVQDGVGRVDTGPGTQAYDLHKGVGILLAPGTKQHFVNTSDAKLSMIMLSWTKNDGLKVAKPIRVVDSDTSPLSDRRAHWVHASKPMFGEKDGINIVILPILIPPGTYAGPHAHPETVEEIWVKTGADTGYAMLGSEIRKIDGTGAFLSPPNGITVHSSMNLTNDPEIWLYLSYRNPHEKRPGWPGGPPLAQ
jgi:mannose-6-phosphate isomerase-like protein (cupin superfamily)